MKKMKIELDEQTHTYLVDGDFATMSVTEMLQSCGISPDYSSVNKEVLNKSAERGVAIHKDLENVLNAEQPYEPKTDYGKQYKEWIYEKAICATAEQPIAYVDGAFVLAGTVDVFGYLDHETPFIADHKTTETLHKESVQAQLSVYNYIAKAMGKCIVNGRVFNWVGAKKFLCFHYKKDGTMEVVEIEPLSDEAVVDILKTTQKGEKYIGKQLLVEEELKLAVEKAEQSLAEIDNARKVAVERCELFRKQLTEKMREQGIKSWETDKVKVTLVGASVRTRVDEKKLKQQYPEVYKDCQKQHKTKESVRVTIRSKQNGV